MPAIYDTIGEGYDRTRSADPGIVALLSDLLQAAPQARCLDVACGTGNYTAALAQRGGDWSAFDQSARMLDEARGKSRDIAWHQMDAAAIGFDDNSFDAATCTLAIHHFPDRQQAFNEIFRVLRPGARFVLFTAWPEQMRNYWISEYFPVMMDRACAQMPARDEVLSDLSRTGFSLQREQSWDITPDLEDLFLYCGKFRPERYLCSSIRRGISCFNNGMCPPAELETGLARLRADMDSGAVRQVQERCAATCGDYVFLACNR